MCARVCERTVCVRACARARMCVCVRANPFYWGSLNINNSATHAFQFYPLNRATFKIKYRLSSSQHVDLHKLTFRRKICISCCVNLPVIAIPTQRYPPRKPRCRLFRTFFHLGLQSWPLLKDLDRKLANNSYEDFHTLLQKLF